MRFSRAFTMIELIFVIVVLGILAAIALPKFGNTKIQADIAKGRADIATIRTAIINERQTRLILGTPGYIDKLSTGVAGAKLFTGNGAGRVLLTYGITAGSGSGDWARVDDTTYTYIVDETDTTFTYTVLTGVFTCTADTGFCNRLVD